MTASFQTGATDRRTTTRRRCKGCGNYVTERFTRVFGNNNDVVYACLECSTMRELRAGSGVTHDS